MGIINLNDDSFYSNSRAKSIAETIKLAEKHISGGAKFLDLGATSTRPGAELSAPSDEYRLFPAIESLRKEFPDVFISIDTYHAQVARRAVEAGADLINDISGGRLDAEMFYTIAALRVPYILMHSIETPETMQFNPIYKDVLKEVLMQIEEKRKQLLSMGVSDIIIDPGFGFGKTLEHNFRLLAGLQNFKLLNSPVLAGVSRKSMITKSLNVPSAEALNGTTALNMYALTKGAHILRVHDAKEASETIELFNQLAIYE
jgi:dihydropteroate synthase